MNLNFGKRVLYATKERVQTRWKFKEKDDKGRLSTIERGVRFKGKWNDFEIKEIQRVSTVKESPNLVHIFMGPLLCVLIYYSAELLLRGRDAPSDIGIVEILPIIFSTLGGIIALGRRTSWIRVEYIDFGGRAREAFFRRSLHWDLEVLLNQLRKLTVKAVKEDRIFREAQEKLKEKPKGE